MQAPFCSIEAEQLSYLGPTDLVPITSHIYQLYDVCTCDGPFDMCIWSLSWSWLYVVTNVSYATVTDQVQYFIRNTSMVVTKIEGSGNGARVYVVSF